MGQNVTQEFGRYFRSAARTDIHIASTAAAGVAPGTALSTTPPMTIHNPANSGIVVAILRVVVGYVSGTLGAGTLVHAFVSSQPAAPTSGTELTTQSSTLAGNSGSAKAYQGSTVGATPTILRPSIILGASLASTAALPAVARDDVDGSIVIPPGSAWCYEGIADAGSSPLVLIGVEWEEVTDVSVTT